MRTNQTQRELVRLLVLQHGLQKASELSGVPYDTVRQWESRRQRKEKQIVTNVTNPVAIVANNVESELADNERETRLSFSRYAKRAAQSSETATLRDAPYVKQAAQVAGLVHGWGENKTGNQFTLNVLNVNTFDVSVEE